MTPHYRFLDRAAGGPADHRRPHDVRPDLQAEAGRVAPDRLRDRAVRRPVPAGIRPAGRRADGAARLRRVARGVDRHRRQRRQAGPGLDRGPARRRRALAVPARRRVDRLRGGAVDHRRPHRPVAAGALPAAGAGAGAGAPVLGTGGSRQRRARPRAPGRPAASAGVLERRQHVQRRRAGHGDRGAGVPLFRGQPVDHGLLRRGRSRLRPLRHQGGEHHRPGRLGFRGRATWAATTWSPP